MTDEISTLSVVVPAFNAAEYLGEALESVFDALCCVPDLNAEVIVVDDGSEDDTARVAERFPVICRRVAHAGVAAARNHGYRLSKGQLLAGVDADDRWSSNRLPPQLARLRADPTLDVSFGLVQQFATTDGVTRLLGLPVAGRLPGTMLLRRAAFERVGGFDESLVLGEFMDWLVRAGQLGIRQHVSEQVCLLRRIHPNNLGKLARDHLGDYLTIARRSLAASGGEKR